MIDADVKPEPLWIEQPAPWRGVRHLVLALILWTLIEILNP